MDHEPEVPHQGKRRGLPMLKGLMVYLRALVREYSLGKILPSSAPEGRYWYQQKHIDLNALKNGRVVDIGSGEYPFPHADVLVELYPEDNRHRGGNAFLNDGRPVVVADVDRLPFRDRSFDVVVCSHVLEHVDDPEKACHELMRVARRGYIETPTYCKDVLFAWTGHIHKWHIVQINNALVFFEYNRRQREGIRASAWRDIILGPLSHPLKRSFWENQDLFNVMFVWEGRFEVVVYRQEKSR